jgi:hypothetical protein
VAVYEPGCEANIPGDIGQRLHKHLNGVTWPPAKVAEAHNDQLGDLSFFRCVDSMRTCTPNISDPIRTPDELRRAIADQVLFHLGYFAHRAIGVGPHDHIPILIEIIIATWNECHEQDRYTMLSNLPRTDLAPAYLLHSAEVVHQRQICLVYVKAYTYWLRSNPVPNQGGELITAAVLTHMWGLKALVLTEYSSVNKKFTRLNRPSGSSTIPSTVVPTFVHTMNDRIFILVFKTITQTWVWYDLDQLAHQRENPTPPFHAQPLPSP